MRRDRVDTGRGHGDLRRCARLSALGGFETFFAALRRGSPRVHSDVLSNTGETVEKQRAYARVPRTSGRWARSWRPPRAPPLGLSRSPSSGPGVIYDRQLPDDDTSCGCGDHLIVRGHERIDSGPMDVGSGKERLDGDWLATETTGLEGRVAAGGFRIGVLGQLRDAGRRG
jgi:hypothetical protein